MEKEAETVTLLEAAADNSHLLEAIQLIKRHLA